METISLPISLGEGLDKLTILDIKLQKIKDERRADCQKEYDMLDEKLKPYRLAHEYYYRSLREINLQLWELQDIFHGKTTTPEEGARICKTILEENDRRFRVKLKINQAAASTLKEQKGYAKKRALIYGHLGLGDMFWMNGAVRYLATAFDEVAVVCKERNKANVTAMYADDPSIIPFIIQDDYVLEPFSKHRLLFEQDGITVFACGFHTANPRIYDFPLSFYDDLPLPRDVRTKYFHVPTVPGATELYEKLGKTPYIIVHEQSSVKILPIWDAVNKKQPEMLILDININHYAPEHPYHSLAELAVAQPILHYKTLLENASEIHLLESSLYCFANHLDLSKVKGLFCYDANKYSNERVGNFKTWSLDSTMQYSVFMDRRKNTFEKAFSLIKDTMKPEQIYTVVELGTSRSFVGAGGDHAGCMKTDLKYWSPEAPSKWDWGAGIFTKVFSDNLRNDKVVLITVDPSDDAVKIASTMCKDNDAVKVIKGYSTDFLRRINFKIDFLYMDHMESGEDACMKHLEDSKIVVERDLMSENGIILIDDVGDNITHTKGKYSIPYLLQNGFELVLHEYQVLLKKSNPGPSS